MFRKRKTFAVKAGTFYGNVNFFLMFRSDIL